MRLDPVLCSPRFAGGGTTALLVLPALPSANCGDRVGGGCRGGAARGLRGILLGQGTGGRIRRRRQRRLLPRPAAAGPDLAAKAEHQERRRRADPERGRLLLDRRQAGGGRLAAVRSA